MMFQPLHWTLGMHSRCSLLVSLCFALFAVQASAADHSSQALGGSDGAMACGGFPKADNGPFDYRKVRDRRLQVVEQFHFTPNVETLISGNRTAYVGGELTFTLRAFPNHHRALVSMVRLTEKLKTTQPPGSAFTIECWLERATRFAPDDPIARMLRSSWLGKQGRRAEAVDQLKVADTIAGDSAFTLHNIGMVYLELGEYELALARAHTAYGSGFALPALRDALRLAGKWREPPAIGVAPASAASSASGGS